MKRFAISMGGVLGLLVLAQGSPADGPHTYGGQQPWYNIFAHRPKLNPEEERLQRFWHDYYDAMKRYYGSLDRIDWVAYYKNHGYQINTGGGAGCYPGCGPSGGPNRIQFAPVFVSPQMQWMVPNSSLSGPPCGPQAPPPARSAAGTAPLQDLRRVAVLRAFRRRDMVRLLLVTAARPRAMAVLRQGTGALRQGTAALRRVMAARLRVMDSDRDLLWAWGPPWVTFPL